MKLSYFQLEPHLNKNLSSIYLLSGEDPLLKQEAIDLVRKAAKQAGFSERIRIPTDTAFEWENLYTVLYSSSLFAERELIEIDFRENWPNKIASKILQEYAENQVKHRLLLINTNKLDEKTMKQSWFKALEKNGVVVTIWPIPREQLPQWILRRAKQYHLNIQNQAALLLADYVEANLIAALFAIEKLFLSNINGPIDEETIHAVLNDESRFTIFDFVETLMMGEKTRAFHILQTLKNEGTEPLLILWGITRELRLLAEMAQQIKQNVSYETLFQQYRIFSRRQASLRKFLETHSEQTCWHLLMHAAEIDRTIKGALPGNPWDNLQLFCLRITG